MTDRSGPPLISRCRNAQCPSKQIIEGLGPAFERPAETVLASPDARGLYRCLWCDKAAETLETLEEAENA
jgi:hypothetical protein